MFFQPKIFVLENVPGLLSANDRAAYKTILSDLQHLENLRIDAAESGNGAKVPGNPVENYYIVYANIVDTTKIGVPQTRRRLIIIGIRYDLFNQLSLIDQKIVSMRLNESLDGQDSLLEKFPMTCLEIFEGKPLNELPKKYKDVMMAYQDITQHPRLPATANWLKRVWQKLSLDDIRHDYFVANGLEETPNTFEDYWKAMQLHKEILKEMGWLGKHVQNQKFPDKTNRYPSLSNAVISRMFMIPPDENYSFVDGTEWEVTGKDISFIYRRSAPLKPAWTVMAYGGGGTYGYHYERNRAQLTLRERARIQTFSDDFVFKSKRVRAQIGEAVPPLLGKRIAENILPILEKISSMQSVANVIP